MGIKDIVDWIIILIGFSFGSVLGLFIYEGIEMLILKLSKNPNKKNRITSCKKVVVNF